MIKEKENTDLILLNGGIALHHADWNWKGVSSPFARLYLVKEGHANVYIRNHVYSLQPGYLYLIPPFTIHGYACDEYFSLYYFHLYEKQTSSIRILEELNYPFEIQASDQDVKLIERLLEINPGRELRRYDPSFYDNTPTLMQSITKDTQSPFHLSLETRGIVYQLLSRFIEHATYKLEISDNRISNVLHYIRKNIDNLLSIDELSAICYLSNDHFIRLFKKETGCTPMQYINQKKIEKAQLMLITTDLPVKDIAYNLSFNNISYFNRLFKKITGQTPGNYIRMV